MSEKNYPKGIYGTDKTTSGGKEVLDLYLGKNFFEWAAQNLDEKGGIKLSGWKKDEGEDTKYGTRNFSLNTYRKDEGVAEGASAGADSDLPF